MTEVTANLFSLDNLATFERPGATVEKRSGEGFAGCWVHLENDWTVSIQWGRGNYSDNYRAHLSGTPGDSTTAEVAVWKGDDGDLVRWRDGDTVLAYVPLDRVQHIIDLCASDALMKEYQPPLPPVEMVADDEWSEPDD